jgi:hypothetical protein
MTRLTRLLLLIAAAVPAAVARTAQSAEPRTIAATFLMDISEAGKTISDSFEMWALNGDLSPMRSRGQAHITLTSIVFIQIVKPRTDVLVEAHETLSVEEVQQGLFRLRFSGNGKACSDLETVIRYSPDYSRLLDLTGSAPGGLKCEHLYEYRVSREMSRAIPALTNGVYLAFPSFSKTP